ncbi:hypothetical protein IWQ56_007010, partial [Coemansia nantahalensis]
RAGGRAAGRAGGVADPVSGDGARAAQGVRGPGQGQADGVCGADGDGGVCGCAGGGAGGRAAVDGGGDGAVLGERKQPQPVDRGALRRADEPHAQPAAGAARGVAGARAGVCGGDGGGGHGGAGGVRESAGGGARAGQHCAICGRVHGVQAAVDRQHVAGRGGGRHPAADGLGRRRRVAGPRRLRAGGHSVRLAVPALQLAVVHAARRLLQGRLPHDVCHPPAPQRARVAALCRAHVPAVRPAARPRHHRRLVPGRLGLRQRIHGLLRICLLAPPRPKALAPPVLQQHRPPPAAADPADGPQAAPRAPLPPGRPGRPSRRAL